MRTIVVAIVALALSIPAAAESRVVAVRGDVTAGPVVAGDEVAWVERTRDGALAVISSAPGRRPRILERLAPQRRRFFFQDARRFAYSGTHLAVLAAGETARQYAPIPWRRTTSFTIVENPLFDRLLAGPADGPLSSVSGGEEPRGGCSRDPSMRPIAVALDGPTLAWAERDAQCGAPGLERVSVRDLASGSEPLVVEDDADGILEHVDVAGRFVAWTETEGPAGDFVAVHDWHENRAVARVRIPFLLTGTYDFDLAGDGSFAISYDPNARSARQRVAWWSPQTNRLRHVPVRPVPEAIAYDGRQVVVVTERGRRRHHDLTSIAVGGARRTIARLPRGRWFTVGLSGLFDVSDHAVGFDLAAGHVAWAVRQRLAPPRNLGRRAPRARYRTVIHAMRIK